MQGRWTVSTEGPQSENKVGFSSPPPRFVANRPELIRITWASILVCARGPKGQPAGGPAAAGGPRGEVPVIPDLVPRVPPVLPGLLLGRSRNSHFCGKMSPRPPTFRGLFAFDLQMIRMNDWLDFWPRHASVRDLPPPTSTSSL